MAERSVQVTTLGGTLVCDIKVLPEIHIAQLKQAIEADGGPLAAQQLLLHGSDMLSDDLRVEECNIEDGAVVNVVVATGVTITGAGNEELNGFYKRCGTLHPTTGNDTGSPVYIKGEGDNMIWIHHYKDAKVWYINGNPSGHLYWWSYKRTPICPAGGWQCEESGWKSSFAREPSPTLAVTDDSP